MELVPKISETERTALEAGVVWVDAELFSGKPNWKNISQEPYPNLLKKKNPLWQKQVDTLCSIVDDWTFWQTGFPNKPGIILRRKILRDDHSYSMEDSDLASAHSEVVAKVSTRSAPLAFCVMVPNSLGLQSYCYTTGPMRKRKISVCLANGGILFCPD